ncbi:glycosyltransferase [Flavobacterium sp. Sd200]|nr:glycosyltransferase [Flavobacterium sp. Sd200]
MLESIYTGYPKFKLKDEPGIPQDKIITFPWFHTPYMKRTVLHLDKWEVLNKEWEWIARQTMDKYVASQITHPTVLIALSSSGLICGKKVQELGGKFICDRGSSHIRFQDEVLHEEYKRWGYKFKGVDPRVIDKEEAEYSLADKITIPSEFVRKSFIDKGVPAEKLVKISYGARLERFSKVGEPDKNVFRVIWVGGVSIRKGFMDALKAFQLLKNPTKEFLVIGGMTPEIKQLLVGQDLRNVTFKGLVPNAELPHLYSTSSVFLFPSLEDGYGMVQGEAMACGCPVIASSNTGAQDLIDPGKQGFIVPVRSPELIAGYMQQLSDNPVLREEMSFSAIEKVKSFGGWDNYGDLMGKLVASLNK